MAQMSDMEILEFNNFMIKMNKLALDYKNALDTIQLLKKENINLKNELKDIKDKYNSLVEKIVTKV